MTDLALRDYDPRDADAVWALHEWALRDAGTDPGDVPGTDDLRDVEATYCERGGAFLVGVGDGDPDERVPRTFDGPLVAMGGFLPTAVGHEDERSVPGAAELHRMRVAPTHQRRGHGVRLLRALERRVAEAGFDPVLATTAAHQAAAVAFYADHGYEAVDRSTEADYELVHFEKEVQDRIYE
jgi:ribosomal protein S18 acetylase RimI-like enzyme